LRDRELERQREKRREERFKHETDISGRSRRGGGEALHQTALPSLVPVHTDKQKHRKTEAKTAKDHNTGSAEKHTRIL
jgi:hypothetical protein